jgi:hypothetical protein
MPEQCHLREALRDTAGGVVAEGTVVAIEGDDPATVGDGDGEALEVTSAASGAVAHDLPGHHSQLAEARLGHHRHVAAAFGGDDVLHRP